MKNAWTEREIQFVKAVYCTIDDTEMAHLLERHNVRSVETKRYRLGFKRPRKIAIQMVERARKNGFGKENPNWKNNATKRNQVFNTKRWKSKNPLGVKAHQKVRQLKKLGRLEQKPCLVCGTKKQIDAHLENYKRPLEIIWLCRKHHNQYHRGIIKKETLLMLREGPVTRQVS